MKLLVFEIKLIWIIRMRFSVVPSANNKRRPTRRSCLSTYIDRKTILLTEQTYATTFAAEKRRADEAGKSKKYGSCEYK